MVAAASDLSAVKDQLALEFHAKTNVGVKCTLGSSGLLAKQIANGAPYDVFLSADRERILTLVQSGHLLADSVMDYAEGRLAIWSKSGKFLKIEDLTAARYISIANPAHAPYGFAAKEALNRAGLWPQVESRIIYGESARQALAYAESGNTDAVLTAWSLLFDRRGALIPASLHTPIRQTGAVASSSKNRELARSFLTFLTGAEGRRLLAAHGLGVLAPGR